MKNKGLAMKQYIDISKINKLIKQNNIDLKTLASHAKLNINYLNRVLEKDILFPPLHVISKLSSALNCNFEDILNDEAKEEYINEFKKGND